MNSFNFVTYDLLSQDVWMILCKGSENNHNSIRGR